MRGPARPHLAHPAHSVTRPRARLSKTARRARAGSTVQGTARGPPRGCARPGTTARSSPRSPSRSLRTQGTSPWPAVIHRPCAGSAPIIHSLRGAPACHAVPAFSATRRGCLIKSIIALWGTTAWKAAPSPHHASPAHTIIN